MKSRSEENSEGEAAIKTAFLRLLTTPTGGKDDGRATYREIFPSLVRAESRSTTSLGNQRSFSVLLLLENTAQVLRAVWQRWNSHSSGAERNIRPGEVPRDHLFHEQQTRQPSPFAETGCTGAFLQNSSRAPGRRTMSWKPLLTPCPRGTVGYRKPLFLLPGPLSHSASSKSCSLIRHLK